jgi:hypothetical protein
MGKLLDVDRVGSAEMIDLIVDVDGDGLPLLLRTGCGLSLLRGGLVRRIHRLHRLSFRSIYNNSSIC